MVKLSQASIQIIWRRTMYVAVIVPQQAVTTPADLAYTLIGFRTSQDLLRPEDLAPEEFAATVWCSAKVETSFSLLGGREFRCGHGQGLT
jgi:hypothetical protein